MRPSDLLLYLLGHRGAIERIAASRQALWAGALLVVSAGIARNYDHLSLLAQPEWLRRVWISQAIMELEMGKMLVPSDTPEGRVLSRYPEIMSFITLKAARLKAQLDPEWEDELWLLSYEEYFSQIQETQSPPR